MKTFYSILQRISGKSHFSYPGEPFELTDEPQLFTTVPYNIIQDICCANMMINAMHSCTISQTVSISDANALRKFKCLATLYSATFDPNQMHLNICERLFSRTQRAYFGFARLARMFRARNSKIVVSHDLHMNLLDAASPGTFLLVDEKTNYLFSIHDLASIIENALGTAPYFFAEPLMPNNPYNNRPFSTAMLCNIYFKLKFCNCKLPLLFHMFFLNNLNLRNFRINCDVAIRDFAIRKYAFTEDTDTLYPEIMDMLMENMYTCKLKIDAEFPKHILVDIFRPYLHYMFIVCYFLRGTAKYKICTQCLNVKFRMFCAYNKQFGRKFYVNRKKTFNSAHIPFGRMGMQLKERLGYCEPGTDLIFSDIYANTSVQIHPTLPSSYHFDQYNNANSSADVNDNDDNSPINDEYSEIYATDSDNETEDGSVG